MSTFVLCIGCGEPLYGFSPCRWCGNDLLDGFCSLCDSRNSCVYDPNSNSFDFPLDSYHPPHPTYETYSYDSYGNDSHFGYDCQPQFLLDYESEPGYIENYNSYPYDSSSFPQQILCCETCGGPHENFLCQPMNQNFYEPNMCSNSISSDFDQFQPSQFPVIHQPPQEISIQEMEDLKQQYLDEMKRLINSEYRDEIKIDELKINFNSMSIEINKKEKLQQLEQVANLNTYPSKHFNSFCYDDDDDEDYTIVITPDFSITNSLIMENEHLDTIPETESDKFIKSRVENLVSIPSESEDFSDIESECDMPDCDDSQTTNFSTFSNPLFDSYLLESLINRDTLMPSSPKFHSLLGEFSGELAHTDLIPSVINEANCDPKEDIHLVQRLLYDSDSEGDILSLERLLHDDPIPLPDNLDFSNVVQVFLPCILGNVKTRAKGFCLQVFISSASIGNYVSKSNRTNVYLMVKDNKEKDKIRAKPDKIKSKRKAWKSPKSSSKKSKPSQNQESIKVKQKKDGIFISQDKYVAKILRKFRLSEGKSAITPIDAEKPLLKDSDATRSWNTQMMRKRIMMETSKGCLGNIEHHEDFDPDEDHNGIDLYKGLDVYIESLSERKPVTNEEFYEKIIEKFTKISQERSKLIETLREGMTKFGEDQGIFDFYDQYKNLFKDAEFNLYDSSMDEYSESESDTDNNNKKNDDEDEKEKRNDISKGTQEAGREQKDDEEVDQYDLNNKHEFEKLTGDDIEVAFSMEVYETKNEKEKQTENVKEQQAEKRRRIKQKMRRNKMILEKGIEEAGSETKNDGEEVHDSNE
nr:hypothetical protein [Tanacetum cinerariifolium]